LWSLAAVLPLAFAISFPAVFVAGAVSLGLLVPVWRSGAWRIWRAFAVYNISLGVAFAGLLWITALSTSPDTDSLMRDYWTEQDGFPPFAAWPLIRWFIVNHLGDKIFAIPYGAENGGGLIAFGLCIVAAVVMYRRRMWPILTVCVAAFGLTFLAAVLRMYPYGGHNRLTQFLVPLLAVSIAIGTATALATLRHSIVRQRMTLMLLGGLALFGAGLCCRDIMYPYHFVHDEHHRDFARWFWTDEPQSITLCTLTDLQQSFCEQGLYCCYRCNQRIYSPRHSQEKMSPDQDFYFGHQSLRLVVFRPPYRKLDRQAVADCLKRFEPQYELTGHENYEPCLADIGLDKYGGYEVFRFIPRDEIAARDPATEIRTAAGAITQR
jgi:hypothetical protein